MSKSIKKEAAKTAKAEEIVNSAPPAVDQPTETTDSVAEEPAPLVDAILELKDENPDFSKVNEIIDGPQESIIEDQVQIEEVSLEEIPTDATIVESVEVLDNGEVVIPEVQEANVPHADIRKEFKPVRPTFNETPTSGMEFFGALFNPNGETEEDLKKQHFAAIYDYVNNRKCSSEVLENNVQITLAKLSELSVMIKQLDEWFKVG